MGGRSLALLFAVLSNIIFHMTDMFHKLLPLTASDNIHQVILNCCDYKGSTKYTDLNLEDLNTGRSSFMERLDLGCKIAHFLSWFADMHKVPPITQDGTSTFPSW